MRSKIEISLKYKLKHFLKKCLILFPPLRRAFNRNYFAATLSIYLVSSFFKKILFINSDADFLVNYTSRVTHAKNIIIGSKTENKKVYGSFVISGCCYYQATNGIIFGLGTIWSFGCHFISGNHSYKNLDVTAPAKPIKIGDYVWIGSNTVILPSVNIGDYCIVGAGSIVTKSFESYTILAGNPAKPIAKRCKKCLDKIQLEKEFCSTCNFLQ
jgi:acetyltransferase-like isoleucine patch superfamily enzyme